MYNSVLVKYPLYFEKDPFLIILVLSSIVVHVHFCFPFACIHLAHLCPLNFFSCHFVLSVFLKTSLKLEFCFVFANLRVCHFKGDFNKFTSIAIGLYLACFQYIYLLLTTFIVATFIFIHFLFAGLIQLAIPLSSS